MKLAIASRSWADFASDELDDGGDETIPPEPVTERNVASKTSPTEGLFDYVSEVRVRAAARLAPLARKRATR